MNEKTLVYGLHNDYVENKDFIENRFQITGYFDSDESRLPQNGGVLKNELEERISDFETILISADPVSIVSDLVELYHISPKKMKVLFYELAKDSPAEIMFFGEHTEDAALFLLIDKLEIPVEKVTYLEIGTNDPVRYNNTYSFYQKGARGTLVDALPAVEYLKNMIRPEDAFINAAVSDASGGEVTFYACRSSTVSSLDEEHHRKWDGISHNGVNEITVPLIGINELFGRLDYEPTMLLVDAEGYDERILRALNYEIYRPRIIMTEVEHLESSGQQFHQFMVKNGYRLFSRVAGNNIYYRDNG